MSHRRLLCECGAKIVTQDDDLAAMTRAQAYDRLLDSFNTHLASMKDQGR